MTTWHQDRAQTPLYNTGGKWRVFTNPPGGMASVMTFADQAGAEEYMSNLRKRYEETAPELRHTRCWPHSYIQPPARCA